MRKGILTVVTIVCIVLNLLGQKSFDSYLSSDRSSISTIEYLNGQWISMGRKGDFWNLFAIAIDTNGTEVWTELGVDELATFTASTVKYERVYATGQNGIAHDYPSPDRNGFVAEFGNTGFIRELIRDTSYKYGFHDIAVDSSYIVVSAAKNWLDSVNRIVCYDTSGQFLWEYDPGWPVKGVAIKDTIVYAYSNDSLITFNLQGTRLPYGIARPIRAFEPGRSEFFLADSIRLHTYDALLGYQGTIDPVETKLDDIQLMRTDSNHVLLMGWEIDPITQDSTYMLNNLLNSFTVGQSPLFGPICHRPNCFAVNTDHVGVGGVDHIGVELGYIKTSTRFYGVVDTNNASVEPIDMSVHVDSYDLLDSIPLSTGQGFYSIAEMVFTYSITLQNVGADTVNSFVLLNDAFDDPFIPGRTFRRKFDNQSLAPGDTVTVVVPNVTALVSTGNPNNSNLSIKAENNRIPVSGCGQATYPLPFVYAVGLSKSLIIKHIQLFPNPAQNHIQLRGLSQPTELTLYNVQGQQVLHTTAHDKTPVDVSELVAGIYFYQLHTQDGTQIVSGKLIKN